jgi:hypothetical protein
MLPWFCVKIFPLEDFNGKLYTLGEKILPQG